MTEWQQVLRDPHFVAPLTVDDADAMRRVMLDAAASAAGSAVYERSFAGAAIGAVLTIAVAAGVFSASVHTPETNPAPMTSTPAVRNLQFATPGGTRIIWQFNPE